MARTEKRRLDALLVERGLCPSREQARAAVLAGDVTVGGRPATKPGAPVAADAELAVARRPRFVSRGGDKLDHALARFGIDVRGAVVADIGASTGGFTDCLLQHGAARVYAIDVGYGVMDYRLRIDPRVVLMERTNARHLAALPEPVDLAVIDVSFISLTKVLPAVRRLLRDDGEVVALIKPQFEAHRAEVGRGGIVRDRETHARVIGRVAAWCATNGLRVRGLTISPILGGEGNREFLIRLRKDPTWQPPSEARRDE
jgi:23S rRNA (cytidine1920-2'-O)/16S rRNA (cytidine1409-2'-O)-methyltransferase